MRTYGRVHTAFWTDLGVRGMSERARTMAFYMLTSPHSNMVGAYLLPDAYLADDLGWSLPEVKKTILELIDSGFCKRFADGRHIAVCKFLFYNPVESTTAGKSIARQFLQLPKDKALVDTIQYLKSQSDRLPESFANDLEIISASHSTSQEQAIAQEQSQECTRATPASMPTEVAQDITEAFGAYNAVAKRVGWSVAGKISKPRIRGISLRLRDCGGLAGWLAAMAMAEQSDFLTGRAARNEEHAGWAPDLDWFLNPKNFTKLVEGSYDQRRSNVRSAPIDHIREGARGAIGLDGTGRSGMESPDADNLVRLGYVAAS